ncbi:alpha/beta fold hydrolase [Aquimarina celericrescens]|uniref:Alpha/beta fold hydrolase n=1 Tax=Aquimarina celericrescens TaxID=1964542 RepID=A0ABW5B233_9FLAO|nr:alpha/beta hydrolase [Aquimarina celericrescens]
MRKVLKTGRIIFFGLTICLIALFIIFYIYSPGKPQSFLDENGNPIENSISIIEKISIGDVSQHLIIRGVDTRNPVLLFIHGGPGFPEFTIFKESNTNLEKEFVVVYWEQRGAGKSMSNNIPDSSMNLEQFIQDTSDVSEYIKKRFNRQKIHLMGHSWGSLVGILTAHRYPQHFNSYVGIGQIVKQYEGEQISLDWIKNEARKRKDNRALKKIVKIDIPDSLADGKIWLDYLMRQRAYVQKYGGGMDREKTNIWTYTVKLITKTKEYTLKEKLNFIKGNPYSVKRLWPDVVQTNLFNEIDSIAIPIYFMHGVHDYQVPYSLAKKFYTKVNAPKKTFISFNNSAHAPFLDETEKFNATIIEKILR